MSEVVEFLDFTEAVGMLEISQEHRDPCENGHVEHTAADHLGRRLVHSMSGTGQFGFGADWDYEAVLDFLRGAKVIRLARPHSPAAATGHGLAVLGADDRWVAFATRKPDANPNQDLL